MMKSTRALASLLTTGALAVGLLASKPAAAGSVLCETHAPETTSSTDAQNVRRITYCGISGENGTATVTKTGATTYLLTVKKESSGAGNATVLLVDAPVGNKAGNCEVSDAPGGSSTSFTCTTTIAPSTLYVFLKVN